MTTKSFIIFLVISVIILALLYCYAVVNTIDYDDVLRCKDAEIIRLKEGVSR